MKKVWYSLAALAMVFSMQQLGAQDLEDILGQVTNPGTKAVYEEFYSFDTYIQLEVSELGNEAMRYDGYLTRDGKHTSIVFDMGGDRTTVVLDTDNNAVLLLSEADGEKAGVALAVNPEALAQISSEINKAVKHDSYAQFKTGKTKEILGYGCEEYLIREDDSVVQIWASRELGKEIEPELLANQQLFGGAFIHAAGMDGMVLEYHFTDTNSGEDRTMKVTKLDLEARFEVSTGDYSIMSLGQ